MTDSIVIQGYTFAASTIRKDEMVNATALATAYQKKTGKRKDVAHWLAIKEAEESIAYLAGVTGIPVSSLVIVEHGVGTWMHPDLAEIFAQWISVEYRFAVVGLIRLAKQNLAPQLPGNYLDALKALVASEEEKAELKIINESLTEDNIALSTALDELWDRSTIKRVAAYNGVSEKAFNWRVLVAACKTIGETPYKVPDINYPKGVNVYSHDAWRLAYPNYRLPETTTLRIDR